MEGKLMQKALIILFLLPFLCFAEGKSETATLRREIHFIPADYNDIRISILVDLKESSLKLLDEIEKYEEPKEKNSIENQQKMRHIFRLSQQVDFHYIVFQQYMGVKGFRDDIRNTISNLQLLLINKLQWINQSSPEVYRNSKHAILNHYNTCKIGELHIGGRFQQLR
jgi:hypothetical protein